MMRKWMRAALLGGGAGWVGGDEGMHSDGVEVVPIHPRPQGLLTSRA